MLNLLTTNPFAFILLLVFLFLSISIHEFAHAWTANRLGDPTPGLAGRLTLNPLAHIDLTGILFLVFFGFGWGKPVGFDPYNLKNPRKDAGIISLAGPLSNFILALILSILLRLFIFFKLSSLNIIGSLFFIPLISLNIKLGIFNLLPVHPLDGFKIVEALLPEEKAREWQAIEKYGIIFLILLIFPIGNFSMLEKIVSPIYSFIIHLFLPLNQAVGII